MERKARREERITTALSPEDVTISPEALSSAIEPGATAIHILERGKKETRRSVARFANEFAMELVTGHNTLAGEEHRSCIGRVRI